MTWKRSPRTVVVFGLFFACGLWACSTSPVEAPEVGPDAGPSADIPPDTTGDSSSEAVTPPSLLEIGDQGFLLRGTVLTPEGPVNDGEVLVEGELITCVALDCTDAAAGLDVSIIETGGVISPGLIDAHNHLPYNFLPPWIPPTGTAFSNRYQWMNDPDYRAHIEPYAKYRNHGTHYCPAAKWGELRSLVHATTTIQGQSFQQRCVDWAVRNADHYHGLQHNHMRTTIASAHDISQEQAQNYIDSFEDENNPTTRLAVHMAEGFEGDGVREEFEAFADLALLDYGTALLIHSVALNRAQLEMVAMTDSQIVWSPSSNFHLYGYGKTAPIEIIVELEITVALGPDWTLSGAFDMLEEMRVAYDYGRDEEIEALTPRRIWEMATADGAQAVGLHDFIGRLEPGFYADLAVFGRYSDDPYRAVLDSSARDVEMVLIGGALYYGDVDVQGAARNEYCDSFDACGRSKFLCVQDDPDADDRADETLDDLGQQLFDILEGTDDSPPEEQYGRGDELLPLAICD